MKNMVFNF